MCWLQDFSRHDLRDYLLWQHEADAFAVAVRRVEASTPYPAVSIWAGRLSHREGGPEKRPSLKVRQSQSFLFEIAFEA